MVAAMKFKPMVVFDRNVIRTNWKKINESPMKRAGLLVRKIARQSIRKRQPGKKDPKTGLKKERPSPAPTPPRSRAPGHPLRLIFSAPMSVADIAQIVGVVGFGGPGTPIPQLHEEGGTALRTIYEKGEQRRSKRTGKFKTGFHRVAFDAIVRYPERPFMAPALEKAKESLPDLWRNSIARSRAA